MPYKLCPELKLCSDSIDYKMFHQFNTTFWRGRRVEVTLNEHIDSKTHPNFRNTKMSIFKLRKYYLLPASII